MSVVNDRDQTSLACCFIELHKDLVYSEETEESSDEGDAVG